MFSNFPPPNTEALLSLVEYFEKMEQHYLAQAQQAKEQREILRSLLQPEVNTPTLAAPVAPPAVEVELPDLNPETYRLKKEIYSLLKQKMGCRLTSEFIANYLNIEQARCQSILEQFAGKLWFKTGKAGNWTVSAELLKGVEDSSLARPQVDEAERELAVLEAKLPLYFGIRKQGVVTTIQSLLAKQPLKDAIALKEAIYPLEVRQSWEENLSTLVKEVLAKILVIGTGIYWGYNGSFFLDGEPPLEDAPAPQTPPATSVAILQTVNEAAS